MTRVARAWEVILTSPGSLAEEIREFARENLPEAAGEYGDG